MIEAELVASRAAVAHLLEERDERAPAAAKIRGLYTCKTGQLLEVLQDAHAYTVSTLSARFGLLAGDGTVRAAEIVEALGARQPESVAAPNDPQPRKLSPCRRWSAVRKIVAARFGPDSPMPVKIALAREVDVTFFAGGDELATASARDQGRTGDAHVHAGGAVRWDSLWCWLMNGEYPRFFLSRAPTRFLKKGELSSLIGKAVGLREDLASIFGPAALADDPGFDSLLFRRLVLCGEQALDALKVRDYVLIRSVARREMLCGEVRDLDEFCGDAWKRYWGQRRSRGGRWLLPLLRRAARMETRKVQAAKDELNQRGVGAFALRLNAGWPPAAAAIELQEADEQGVAYIIHAGRPSAPAIGEGAVQWSWRLGYEAAKWHGRLRVANHVRRQNLRGLDIAGPERNTPQDWFKDILEMPRYDGLQYVTIHVGEDFHDPWQGLCRVLSVANHFQARGCRPRIGHASVLGINPYRLRWKDFKCPLWARREALKCALRLGRPTLSADELSDIHQTLRGLPQGNDPRLEINVRPSNAEQESFRKMRKHITGQLGRWRTIVESNPTSNLMVLGCPDFEWVPFWSLVAAGLHVVLGSDDPGLMYTSIEEEWTRLRARYDARLELERSEPKAVGDLLIKSEYASWESIECTVRRATQKLATFEP